MYNGLFEKEMALSSANINILNIEYFVFPWFLCSSLKVITFLLKPNQPTNPLINGDVSPNFLISNNTFLSSKRYSAELAVIVVEDKIFNI